MSNEKLREEIQYQIDSYIEKYCIKHKVSKEEARNHAMVKLTTAYYMKGQNK